MFIRPCGVNGLISVDTEFNASCLFFPAGGDHLEGCEVVLFCQVLCITLCQWQTMTFYLIFI